MIKSHDITVIVQGPISNFTKNTLSSVRKILPESKIILSTWPGSEALLTKFGIVSKESKCKALEPQNSKREIFSFFPINSCGAEFQSELSRKIELFDKLIINSDPGAMFYHDNRQKVYAFNLNRQLISTQMALKQIKTQYVLKLRSDLVLTSRKFIEQYERFRENEDKYHVFKQKLCISSIFTRYRYTSGKFKGKLPYHVSDFFFFGLTEDLKSFLLNTRAIDADFLEYFYKHPKKQQPYSAPYKFAPEQYFATEFLKRNQDYGFSLPEDAADLEDDVLKDSHLFIMNNFIVLDYKQAGIYSLKYPFTRNEKFLGEQYEELYNHPFFEHEYRQYCDPNYKPLSERPQFKSPVLKNAYYRLYRHLYKAIFRPRTKFIKRISQLLVDLPFYALKFVFLYIIVYCFYNTSKDSYK